MEDFLGVVVLIIYLFAVASGKKKKAQKKQKKVRQGKRERSTAFEQAFDQTAEMAKEPVKPEKPEEEPCAQQRLHLHDVTQGQMQAAMEGEDPCHAGDSAVRDDQQEESDAEYARDDGMMAQNVLRGVIMSEILTRPCDRAAARRNRWSAV